MKIFKMLLAVTMVTGIFSHVIADENTPMITDGVVDLEQYLFGDVDSNGQTILHRIASNCDNDAFTVRFKIFNFLENFEQSEGAQALQSKVELYSMISGISEDKDALLFPMIFLDVNRFVQKKDNNGDIALDIARKRNSLNPHKRCTACIEFLEIFEKFNNSLHQ